MDVQASIQAALGPLNERLDKLAENQARAEVNLRTYLTGRKPMAIALITGKAVSNVLSIGGDSGQALVTPEAGYIWALRQFIIEGLTTGATPDRVQMVWGGRIQWELNGNSYGQTFGRGEQIIWPGQTITLQSPSGFSFASTSTIIGHGFVDNLPGEFQGELI